MGSPPRLQERAWRGLFQTGLLLDASLFVGGGPHQDRPHELQASEQNENVRPLFTFRIATAEL